MRLIKVHALALGLAVSMLGAGRGSPTDDVVDRLSTFVGDVVEPALQEFRAHESNSTEDCFATAAGRLLRSRCCVYFSNVAGSLIQSRFGALAGRGGMRVGDEPPLPRLTYELLAKWLLSNVRDPLAITVGAERIGTVEELHRRAKGLPGPTGLYSAEIEVAGVRGTLTKCEMGTVHTYLVFSAPGRINDVLIDVTYKQFLVITEWMDTPHFEASEKAKLLGDRREWYVGTDAMFQRDVMTLATLRDSMRQVYALAGEDAAEEEHKSDTELGAMYSLIEQMFGLGPNSAVRSAQCGKPNQALGMRQEATAFLSARAPGLS